MKTNDFIKREWLILLFILAPFAIIPLIWNSLPEQIPMHWNFAGEIDSWSPKYPGIFYIPLLNVVMYVLFLVIPKIDPRKQNYSLFEGAYKKLRLVFSGFILYMFVIITLVSTGYDLNVKMFIVNGILVLFLIFGNFMGNLRSNYFVGFRVPWTLEFPEVWTKTHRFAGKTWVIGSIIMFLLGFVLPDAVHTVTFFVFIGVISIIPLIYSYILYLRIKKENSAILK